jgi:predicted Zn-dependent protease with MMP-like domain
MNERIKELAEQAIKFIPNDVKDEEGLAIFIEKYSRLIIKECVEVCYEVNREYEDEDVYASAIWCAHEIHKHFGVEK